MKSKFFVVLFLFGLIAISAQSANRVSPLDSVKTHIKNVEIEITYSRPFLKGRTFGKDIVPYGKIWRTGANEATVFETNQDILIDGQLLPAGKYSLYSIPGENETMVIFNKDWDQWGTIYNEDRDALRVKVPTFTTETETEQFTIDIDSEGETCLSWGTCTFIFHIEPQSEMETTVNKLD